MLCATVSLICPPVKQTQRSRAVMLGSLTREWEFSVCDLVFGGTRTLEFLANAFCWAIKSRFHHRGKTCYSLVDPSLSTHRGCFPSSPLLVIISPRRAKSATLPSINVCFNESFTFAARGMKPKPGRGRGKSREQESSTACVSRPCGLSPQAFFRESENFNLEKSLPDRFHSHFP